MTPPPQLETKSSKTPFLALIATLPASSKLLAMSLFFLKIGATLFGSGYVLVSYLQGGLVDELHWMTSKELADAIAVGQVTPGPLLTTSTFIGYILGYRWGGHRLAVVAAVVATASIFAPSFFFVALLGRAWPRIRASRYARGALDGMNAAVTALIAITAIQLAQQSIQSVPAVLIAIATLMVLLKWKIDSTWLVLGAALVGLML